MAVDGFLAAEDDFEPFATAGVPLVGLVMSFRKPAEHPDLREMPGQYI